MKKTMHQSGLTRLRAQHPLLHRNTMQTLMPQARRTTSFASKKRRQPAVSTFGFFRKQFIFQFDLRKIGEASGVWIHRMS